MPTSPAPLARRLFGLFLIGLFTSLPTVTPAQDVAPGAQPNSLTPIAPSANTTAADGASAEGTAAAFDGSIETENGLELNQNTSEVDPQQVRQVAMLLGGFLLLVVFGTLSVFLVLQGVACYFMAAAIKVLPDQHLQITSGKIWLQMIPCFNLIWAFIVVQGISGSFQSYFQSRGQTQHGDCHNQLGIFYCIAVLCNFVPYLNTVALPATIGLLIVYLVRIHRLKDAVAADRHL